MPSSLRGHALTTGDYVTNLEHLARNGLRGIAFTGGEPTLNSDLPQLVSAASSIFERVELTTNGRFLVEMLPNLAPHLDLLKVSLDAVEPQLVWSITGGTPLELDGAIASIRAGCNAGLCVGVSVVVMRSTVCQIEKILDLCREINSEKHLGQAYVSLLDFYYSEERRSIWEREFLPLSELIPQLTSRYGPCVPQQRFGCQFSWLNGNGVKIRLKDSFSVTHRAPKCHNCQRYCQEGIYGLKLSVEGWVTTCPTGDPEHGVHLAPGLSDHDADQRLAPLIQDIQHACPDYNSFSTMLKTHGLQIPSTHEV